MEGLIMYELTIIIPVKNDNRVIDCVPKIISTFQDNNLNNYEVLIIHDDDKSYDLESLDTQLNSKSIIREIKNEGKFGKGGSVKFGLTISNSDTVCIIDCDQAVDINDVAEQCKNYSGGYLLYGVRVFGPGIRKFRRMLGLVQLFLANSITLKKFIQDTQCPFKIMDRQIADSIENTLTVAGGMYDVQIFRIAELLDIPLLPFPVCWQDAEGSVLNISKNLVGDFVDLFKIKLFTRKKNEFSQL